MTPEQRNFLELAIIEQFSYARIVDMTGLTREQLTKWWDELRLEREKLAKIRVLWRKKFKHVGFYDFEQWYDNAKKECHYCGITENKINILLENNRINTKRLKTRGRRLEIERLNSNEPYDNLENLVYSCYWCNNAKSDEFSEKEFKKIGGLIKKIWENRLDRSF